MAEPFDEVVYIPTAASEREVLERILIKAINPQQNRNGKSAVQMQPNAATLVWSSFFMNIN
jgi:hypothetical protein